jgi:hypothetical protein
MATKQEKHRRSKMVSVRFTPGEYSRAKSAARVANSPSLADHIRGLVAADADEVGKGRGNGDREGNGNGNGKR